jgi:hypothetical protein
VSEGESNLHAVLETFDAKARNDLRSVLIRDQAERDAIASRLLRYRDGHGDDWADIIDMLTMHPEARRKDPDQRRRVVRLLGELEAGMSEGPWTNRGLMEPAGGRFRGRCCATKPQATGHDGTLRHGRSRTVNP